MIEDLRYLSLLKNLSEHRGRSSATAPCSEICRSRNPVAVIVKIESRDLDRRPGIWAALRPPQFPSLGHDFGSKYHTMYLGLVADSEVRCPTERPLKWSPAAGQESGSAKRDSSPDWISPARTRSAQAILTHSA